MYKFDAKRVKDECVQWIRDWFEENGDGCNAIIGISGGKDSSVVAALCVEALGKDRVVGVLMPNGEQKDIDVALDLCKVLDIEYHIINIHNAFLAIKREVKGSMDDHWSKQTATNLPARLRMCVLYAVSQTINGRVANTCNLSEDWVGYATRYGDSAGDFSPLSNLTVEEVKAIGYECGLPKRFIEKTPIDGLCGKTDEDNLGFTYAVLDKYIRTGEIEDIKIKEKIDMMHEKNLFKLQLMPSFTFMAHDVRKKLEDLKTYEDTYLTPDQIRELKERDTSMEINEIYVDEYYCPACGAENNCDQGVVKDKFCPRCGQRLKVRNGEELTMRQILFRAKRTDNGEWVNGNVLQFQEGDCYIATSYLVGEKDEPLLVASREVNPETICRYTGLKDKNRNRICENDIVEDKRFDGFYKVVFRVRDGGWYVENLKTGALFRIIESTSYQYKICGNCFDNSELLKGE